MLNQDGAITIPGFGYESLNMIAIATRLGRELRFGRGVRVWFTVLSHSLVVETICSDMLENKRKRYRNSVRLYALLHDAHEAAWGDVPTPLKTDDIRRSQREMDRTIYAMLNIPDIPPQYEPIIKRADTRAMLAEGEVIGPAGWYENYAAANPEVVAEFKRYARGDREIVATIAQTYPDCRHTFSSISPGVTEYLRSLEEAIQGSGLRDEDEVAA